MFPDETPPLEFNFLHPAQQVVPWPGVSSSVCFEYSGQFTGTQDHHRVSKALCCPGSSPYPEASSPQVSSPLPVPPLTADELET